VIWSLFADPLLRTILVPRVAWSAPSAPAPDYSRPSGWFARPDLPDDPTRWLPRGMRPAADRPVAIFYVLPTTSLTRHGWNVSATDAEALPLQRAFASGQASALTAVGKVWSPRYRQAVLGAFFTDKPDGPRALDFAYRDVERAFAAFLAQIPANQPILLAGHSQGALHLIRLMREHVADKPVAKRIVAAYLVGWPISIAHDLPFLGLPQCSKADDAHCILSWQSFAQPADPYQILALYEKTPGFDGKSRMGSPMLCVNPLSGRADIVAMPAAANRGALLPDHKLVPVGIKAGTVPADCTPEGWLDIGEPPAGYSGYVFPGNNYHVFDYALFWTNIRADAERRTLAFLK